MAKLEKEYYPQVERWMKKHFKCFKTSVDSGLKYGRIDIAGVRDVGGDLTGDVDVIAIEVKRGKTPFVNMCGQTLGYGILADLIYLADVREEGFTPEEIHIASHVGIGLIQIRKTKCIEVLSSRYQSPMPRMRAALLEKLQLGKCQWCESLFGIGGSTKDGFSRVVRQRRGGNKIQEALDNDKGLMFWSSEVAERKRKLGLRKTKEGHSFERRFICPDCIDNIAHELLEDE